MQDFSQFFLHLYWVLVWMFTSFFFKPLLYSYFVHFFKEFEGDLKNVSVILYHLRNLFSKNIHRILKKSNKSSYNWIMAFFIFFNKIIKMHCILHKKKIDKSTHTPHRFPLCQPTHNYYRAVEFFLYSIDFNLSYS